MASDPADPRRSSELRRGALGVDGPSSAGPARSASRPFPKRRLARRFLASSEGAAASSSAPAPSRSSAHRRVNACDGVPMVIDAGVTNAAADEAVSEQELSDALVLS